MERSVRYQRTKKWIADGITEPHWGYGIAVMADREEQPRPELLEDVSTDGIFVGRLVDLYNRLKLDPIHLLEVTEDQVASRFVFKA